MCPADCRDGREGEREKRECVRERDIKRERERLLPKWCTAELGRLPDRHGAWTVNEVG